MLHSHESGMWRGHATRAESVRQHSNKDARCDADKVAMTRIVMILTGTRILEHTVDLTFCVECVCVCLPVQDYKQQETRQTMSNTQSPRTLLKVTLNLLPRETRSGFRPAFCEVLKACHAFDKKLSFQIFEICQDQPLTENAASCRGRSEQIRQCPPTPPTPVCPLRGTQTHSFPKAVITVRRGSGPGVPP